MHGYYSILHFIWLFGVQGKFCERVGSYQILNAFFPRQDSRVTDSEPLCRLHLCVSLICNKNRTLSTRNLSSHYD